MKGGYETVFENLFKILYKAFKNVLFDPGILLLELFPEEITLFFEGMVVEHCI